MVPLKRVVRALRRLGFGVAVDDAGAGYASFTLIAALRPSAIKIDREIVQGSARNVAKRALIEAFVGFARRIDARLVAEGIERRADLAVLVDAGVDLGQGYLLGRAADEPVEPLAEPHGSGASRPSDGCGQRRPRPVPHAWSGRRTEARPGGAAHAGRRRPLPRRAVLREGAATSSRQKAGMSSTTRPQTRFPSRNAGSSTQVAPAFTQVVADPERARRAAPVDDARRDRDQSAVADDPDRLAGPVDRGHEVRHGPVAAQLVGHPAAGDHEPVVLVGVEPADLDVDRHREAVLAPHGRRARGPPR